MDVLSRINSELINSTNVSKGLIIFGANHSFTRSAILFPRLNLSEIDLSYLLNKSKVKINDQDFLKIYGKDVIGIEHTKKPLFIENDSIFNVSNDYKGRWDNVKDVREIILYNLSVEFDKLSKTFNSSKNFYDESKERFKHRCIEYLSDYCYQFPSYNEDYDFSWITDINTTKLDDPKFAKKKELINILIEAVSHFDKKDKRRVSIARVRKY